MMKILAIACAASVTFVPVGAAQPATPPAPAGGGVTALMVEVVISRYLNDKRVSSTPFTLAVVPDTRSSLRMGGQIPVPSITTATKDGTTEPTTSYSYRTIGTDIDVAAAEVPGGRYRLTLTIEENSVYSEQPLSLPPRVAGAPALRGFRTTNAVVLRDGQSIEYTTATDRISGEVFRVSVKMTVVR